MAARALVISSVFVLLVALENRVAAQPLSIWSVSSGGCGLARAQSATMFTPS